MTDDFGAYSPQLKRATKRVAQILKDLTERHVNIATLYHYGNEGSDILAEGEIGGPTFDRANSETLSARIKEFEQTARAPFVARFVDTGSEGDRTAIAVHPLGSDPKLVQPDKTHLRLRSILHQKRDQLPKAARGIIVLELSALDKLGIDQRTLAATLYGDMQITMRVGNDSSQFESEFGHRRNGFFAQTTRVSAAVVERNRIREQVEITREVFPTHNSSAVLLTRAEIECFGTLAPGFEYLCG